MEVEKELSDVLVKCMHPHGPATTFHWPSKDYMLGTIGSYRL